jgi:hypothetical protein
MRKVLDLQRFEVEAALDAFESTVSCGCTSECNSSQSNQCTGCDITIETQIF